jgi:type VI protein secretion system component Hcp
MANDKSNDILMKFEMLNGQAVDGEAQSQLDSRDMLLKDFKPGKFFQVEDFAFGVEVSDEDPGTDSINAVKGASANLQAKGPKIKFGRWKSAKTSEAADIKYPVQMDPFSFTRVIDKASMTLFDSCINSISFKSATLIKRKITGHHRDTTELTGLQTFLRIDFTDVLLISLEWDDGDAIKEKGKFVYRGMEIQYRRQKPDGTLGSVSNAPWAHEIQTAQNAGGKQ